MDGETSFTIKKKQKTKKQPHKSYQFLVVLSSVTSLESKSRLETGNKIRQTKFQVICFRNALHCPLLFDTEFGR